MTERCLECNYEMQQAIEARAEGRREGLEFALNALENHSCSHAFGLIRQAIESQTPSLKES